MTNVTAAAKARCPMCDRLIERPKAMEPQRFADFEFGLCECGAVYVHDITGHNLGAALVEALGCACNDNWDMVWELASGEDYHDALLEGYDIESNLIEPTGRTKEGKRVKGVLTFVRLAEDLREITRDEMLQRFAVRKKTRESQSQAEMSSVGKDSKAPLLSTRYSKQEIAKLVDELQIETLSTMAIHDPLVIRKIQRLLYAADIRLRWKAVLALGAVVGRLAAERPATAGNMVRTLLYACNDSAATNWGAIETLGEIIRLKPDIYGSFVRHLLGLLNDPPSRPAIFWAIGRIGAEHQRLIKSNAFFSILNFLKDPDPNVRGHAVWALGRIRAIEAVSALEKMTGDDGELDLFDGDALIKTTVGRLAEEAVLHIKNLNRGDDMNMTGINNKNDTSSDAVAIYMEGVMLMNRGMSLDALLKLETALKAFEREGMEVEAANACEKLADLHIQRGNFKAAMPLYQRAMAICEKGGDDISKVILAEKVIDLYRASKEFEKALPYFLFALELVESLGDASRAAYYLTGIGDIYQQQGNIDGALDAYRLAHKIYAGMGSRERVEVLERGIKALEGIRCEQ